jgi:hypothetical protein
MLASEYPLGKVSVIVVATPAAASVWVAPVTAVPLAVVVICWVTQPLSPAKENGPYAPLLTFVRVSVGSLVRVNVHVTSSPAARAGMAFGAKVAPVVALTHASAEVHPATEPAAIARVAPADVGESTALPVPPAVVTFTDAGPPVTANGNAASPPTALTTTCTFGGTVTR